MKKIFTLLAALLTTAVGFAAAGDVNPIPGDIDLTTATITNVSSFSPSVKDNGGWVNLDYFGEGDAAEFKIQSTADASYSIVFETATPQENSNADFIILDANGQELYKSNAIVEKTGENGGDWDKYVENKSLAETPVLPAGTYTLRFVAHQGTIWETYTFNVRKISFEAHAAAPAAEANFVFLGGSNLDKEASDNTIYKFTGTDFTLSMNNRDKARSGVERFEGWSSDIINFKNNDWGIINVPTGKKVYALAIGGYSESSAGNLCYLYTVDVDGKNVFTEAIGTGITDNTVINNAKYIIQPDGTAPQFALIDLTAAPAADNIKVVFSGNNQEDVWFKLYVTEEDANTVLGKSSEGGNAATVIYSWVGGEAGATEKGGKAVASDDESVNYVNADYYTIRINKKKADIATDNVTITLDEALEAGDEIAITAYRNKDDNTANGTLYMLFENGTEIDEGDEVVWNNIHPDYAQEPNTRTYTVNAEAGSKTIKIARSKASTNVFITKIVITRGGSSTGIETVEVAPVKQFTDAIYNLRGQRVDASYKGIVIKNGKKFFQK